MTLISLLPTILCLIFWEVDFYLRGFVLADVYGDSNWRGDVWLLLSFIKGDLLLTIDKNELEAGLFWLDLGGLLILLPLNTALCWRILEYDLYVSIYMRGITYFIASLKELIVLDWLNNFFLRSNVTLLSSS